MDKVARELNPAFGYTKTPAEPRSILRHGEALSSADPCDHF